MGANVQSRCRGSQARGFSLLEMMLVFAILVIVMAVVVRGITQMQHRNSAETAKVDTVQETRDFIDQMVRDIHAVGYPSGRVINNNPSCDPAVNANAAAVSCGLIYFSPTLIKYEGDLDGTGTVYQVWMQLIPGPNGQCPCVLQRGVISKAAVIAGQQPTYFTEVSGVLNSGDGTSLNGSGAATYPLNVPGSGSYSMYATADVFDAYFNDGTYFVNQNTGAYKCSDVLSCGPVRSLQITANVIPSFADPKTNTYQVYSITSKARLNN